MSEHQRPALADIDRNPDSPARRRNLHALGDVVGVSAREAAAALGIPERTIRRQ